MKKKKSKNKKVIISVRGGVAYVDKVPTGVTVEVRDYDIEGGVNETSTLKKDEDGDEFVQYIYE